MPSKSSGSRSTGRNASDVSAARFRVTRRRGIAHHTGRGLEVSQTFPFFHGRHAAPAGQDRPFAGFAPFSKVITLPVHKLARYLSPSHDLTTARPWWAANSQARQSHTAHVAEPDDSHKAELPMLVLALHLLPPAPVSGQKDLLRDRTSTLTSPCITRTSMTMPSLVKAIMPFGLPG
jgi:hypothetical protein